MEQRTRKPLTLGVDLGGTKIEVALVDSQGQILSSHHYPTNPEKGADGIVDDILTCTDECLGEAWKEARALGIGVAGQVSSDGIVQYAPNLGWHDVPLKSKLERRLGIPVAVINDVNAATWGEWSYGSGKGVDDLVVLFVGTGVGGGIVSGGRILTGSSNTAGELGHMTLLVGGRKCHCPNRGCLEAYVGGWAIAERAKEAVRADPQVGKHLLSLAGNIEKITAVTVSRAYYDEDLLAHRLVEETGQYLGAGATSIVNALNPRLLVFGGGVIEGIPDLIHIAEAAVQKQALVSAVEKLKMVKAALGSKAGVVGAATSVQSIAKNHV